MSKFRDIYVPTLLKIRRRQNAARLLIGLVLLRDRFENGTVTQEFAERFGFTQGLMACVVSVACRAVAGQLDPFYDPEKAVRYDVLCKNKEFEKAVDEAISKARKEINNDELCNEIEQCLNPGNNVRFLFRRFKKAPPHVGRPRINAKAGC